MAAVLAPADWEALIAAFREHKRISGEIKPSTWHRVYRHHMNHVLGAVAAVAPPQNAKQLLETLARIWADKPGGRTRQIQIQSTSDGVRGAIACGESDHDALGGGAHPCVGAGHPGCPLALCLSADGGLRTAPDRRLPRQDRAKGVAAAAL